MKKVSFRLRSFFDNEQFLTYDIDNEAQLDEDVLDFLEDEEPEGIVPIIFEEGEEHDTFSYDITDKIRMSELSNQEINAEMVLLVLRGLLLALIEMAEYRVPLSYLVLHRHYIYVDSDYKVEFLCIPLEEMQGEVDLNGFLRNFLASLRFEPTENGDYVARLFTYINNPEVFNLRNTLNFVERMIDKMGIEIPEDAASSDVYVEYQEVMDDEVDTAVDAQFEGSHGDTTILTSDEEEAAETFDGDFDTFTGGIFEAAADEMDAMDALEAAEAAEAEGEETTGTLTEEMIEEPEAETEEEAAEEPEEEAEEEAAEEPEEEAEEEAAEEPEEEAEEEAAEEPEVEAEEEAAEEPETEAEEEAAEEPEAEAEEEAAEEPEAETEEETAEEPEAETEEEAAEEPEAEAEEEAAEEPEAEVEEEAVEEPEAETEEEAPEKKQPKTTKGKEKKQKAETGALKLEEEPEEEVKEKKALKKPVFKTRDVETPITGVVIQDELDEFLAEKDMEDRMAHHDEIGLKVKKNIKVSRASIVKNTQEELKAAAEEAAEEEAEHQAETEVAEEEEVVSNSILSQTLGMTGLLKNTATVPKVNPYLIRVNTNERIMVTKQNFKLGKASMGVDYTIKGNGAVSRVHAVITNKDGVYYIRDNKSTNHTFVNGKQLEEGENELLTQDCKIVLGDEEFTFKLR